MKILTLLLCVCITACSTYIDTTNMNRHRQVQTKAKLHGVHSDDLRNSMQGLNLLLIDNIYSPRQAKETALNHLEILIQITGDVVDTTELLTSTGTLQGLSPKQIVIFRRLAEQLQDEARGIKIQLQNNELSEINTAFQRLENTCIRCHSLFREL